MGARPPPGGPIAATKRQSCIVRKVLSRAYHPWWSMNCRSSSMGGCAPYFSFWGMFRSSIMITSSLPTGGPKKPLRRLSSLASIKYCVTLAEVLAEKPTKLGGEYFSLSIASRCPCKYTDLPVPVGPQNRMGFWFFRARSARNMYRTVSTVGTMMLLNAASGGMGDVSIMSSQATHVLEAMSQRKSYTVAFFIDASPSVASMNSGGGGGEASPPSPSAPSAACGGTRARVRTGRSAGGRGVLAVMCPSGMSSGKSYFSPEGPANPSLSRHSYAARRNVSNSALCLLDAAEPPTDQVSANTNVASMCVSISFFSSLVIALGSESGATNNARNVRMSVTATFVPSSVVAATSFISLLKKRMDTGRSQSKRPSTRSLNFLSKCSGNSANHETHRGRHPSWCGSRYTMPQRETVAGDATARSATSKIMFITLDMAMISPEFRHSFLLSSSTVFMFSIQMASTGPSSTTHLRFGDWSCAQPR